MTLRTKLIQTNQNWIVPNHKGTISVRIFGGEGGYGRGADGGNGGAYGAYGTGGGGGYGHGGDLNHAPGYGGGVRCVNSSTSDQYRNGGNGICIIQYYTWIIN